MQKLKNKKNIIGVCAIVLLIIGVLLCGSSKCLAASTESTIVLSDTEIIVNGETISTDSSSDVYKSVNVEVNDDVNEEIQNTIINITKAGTYRISGNITNGQVAVNTGDEDEVNIILDNVSITCKTAPAIMIYNALDNEKAGEAGVSITLADNSDNTIIGSHIPKNATYNKNGESITYEAKYDGAISSAVSLEFNGTGTLSVDGDKEGIETKLHLTINGGNIDINSGDDAINASEDNVSVITINDGTIYANIKDTASEGDGIDSNGYIYINGGEVYAFASSKSQDSGLDSDLGIYINGGTVVGTGNMVDEVSSDSKQKYIFLQLNSQLSENILLTITDENDSPIMAYLSDKSYTTFLYSSADLNLDSYNVYVGGTVEGTSTHGLYKIIKSYTKGTEASYSEADRSMGMMGERMDRMQGTIETSSNNTNVYLGIALIVLAIVIIAVVVINLNKNKNDK